MILKPITLWFIESFASLDGCKRNRSRKVHPFSRPCGRWTSMAELGKNIRPWSPVIARSEFILVCKIESKYKQSISQEISFKKMTLKCQNLSFIIFS